MTAKYKAIEKVNPRDPEGPRKFYPSLQTDGRVTIRTLAMEAADRSSMSEADSYASIANLWNLIPRHLAEGKIVDLDDFGVFKLSITTEGSDTLEGVTSRNIKSIGVRFIPGPAFMEILARVQFEKVANDKTTTGSTP